MSIHLICCMNDNYIVESIQVRFLYCIYIIVSHIMYVYIIYIYILRGHMQDIRYEGIFICYSIFYAVAGKQVI